jgi:hypothetical protein
MPNIASVLFTKDVPEFFVKGSNVVKSQYWCIVKWKLVSIIETFEESFIFD